MKSTPGSVRATPLHGQVKFVPSTRNWFSLVPDPNADTVVTVPLDGEVGEIPGAALIKSNMPARRRDCPEVLEPEAGSEPAVPRLDT